MTTNTKSLNSIGKESLSSKEQQEEEIEINEEDEHLGIMHLSKEELIDTIRDIREEYFELQDDHEQLENKLQERIKEVENNRKLLTEREDLLLQLQWDPQEDQSYVQQMGASDTNHANELKMKAMMDQMRIMERGVFERDEKIKQMEKMIEQFTLSQINSGVQPTQIIYSQFNTIPPSPTPSQLQFDKLQKQDNNSSKSNIGQLIEPNGASIEDSPSPFDSISKYPLSKKIIDNIEQAVIVPSSPSNNLNRSTSFWRSPSTFFSNLLGKSSDQDVNNSNNNNDGNDESDDDDDEDVVEDDEDDEDDYSKLDTKPFSVPVEMPSNVSKPNSASSIKA